MSTKSHTYLYKSGAFSTEQPPEVVYKKAIKKLANSQKKPLCWSLFLIKNTAKNIRERLLLKMRNWEKIVHIITLY